MRVNKIIVENFGKYKYKEFDIESGKLYVVTGRNGAGKSTLFVESLGWCLYGDMWRGGQRDDVIKDGEGWCSVQLVTDAGIIQRRRERGKGSVVKVNDKVVSDVDILNLVKLKREMFFNAVVFGNAMSGFLFLSDGDKREMLAEIVYKELDELVDRLKDNKKEIEQERKVILKELEMLEYREKELLRDTSDLKKRLEEQEEVVGLEDKEKELTVLLDKEKFLKQKQVECEEVIESVEKDIRDIEQEIRGREKDAISVKEKINNLLNRIGVLSRESKCPTCLQSIDQDYRDGVVNELSREVNKLNNEIEKIEKVLSELNEMLVLKRKELQSSKALSKQLVEELRDVYRNKDEVQRVLRVLEKKNYERESIQDGIKRCENGLKRIEQNKAEVERRLREKDIEVQASEFWIDVFTRYKAELFDKVMDVLDVVANDVLMKLSDGRFKVEMGLGVRGRKRVGEKFVLDLYDGGNKILYNRLSGGEKRLVVLGLNLALNYVLSRVYASDFNVMIFDEVFDALDVGVREKVTDLLLEMVLRTGKAIIVITHDDFSYRESEFCKVVVG